MGAFEFCDLCVACQIFRIIVAYVCNRDKYRGQHSRLIYISIPECKFGVKIVMRAHAPPTTITLQFIIGFGLSPIGLNQIILCVCNMLHAHRTVVAHAHTRDHSKTNRDKSTTTTKSVRNV